MTHNNTKEGKEVLPGIDYCGMKIVTIEFVSSFIDMYNFLQGANIEKTDEMYKVIAGAKEAFDNTKNIKP